MNGTLLLYEDCGDGTVVDLNTGFMWEQKVEGGDETTCLTELHGVDSQCDWSQANGEWIDAVNAEEYAGYSDWRLPHVKELQSIVDYSTAEPAIRPILGPTASSNYWTATPDTHPSWAWMVFFDPGIVFNGEKWQALHVRAVRNGECPSTIFPPLASGSRPWD
jgi:hypothetical protein